MKIKKIKFLLIITALLSTAVFIIMKSKPDSKSGGVPQEVKLAIGPIYNIISTTGTVLPKNRLEIKPPVNGRIESILAREGEDVKVGQILVWMSSTERAALLDAAQGQGEEELKYWQEAYKPIALLAPISGEVIVSIMQPGQAVTTGDAAVVLSDQLIVRAQVDETDIGKIKLKQKAVISLDAYPDIKINAIVEHIYYESETINNVTIYKVDLIPQEIPDFFRSGMNATVDFRIDGREDALLVPVGAVYKEGNESYVLMKNAPGKNPLKRAVRLGITDDKNYEVISGISRGDIIIITVKEYILPGDADTGSNPFMPNMPGSRKSRRN